MCVSGKPIARGRRAGRRPDRRGDRRRSGRRAPSRLRARSRAAACRIPKTRDRRDRLGTPEANAPLFAAGRELARQDAAPSDGAAEAVEAIEAAATLPFDEGCRRERELFFECVRSEQAQGADPRLLRRAGGREGAGRAEGHAGDADRARSRSSAPGTMGGGIAMACANAGLRVVLDRHRRGRRSTRAWRRSAATTSRRSSAAG